MDPIRSVPSAGPVVPEVRPVSPVSAPAAPEARVLEPAVSVDVRGQEANQGERQDGMAAEKRGFVRDADSRSLVFQVTDARTGDIVIQIPDSVVLKARAYAREAEEPVGERLERSA